MNRFKAHVQGMKIDEQRSVEPSDLGMEIKDFQDFANLLLDNGYAVGDANFIGRNPHRESETGRNYIDILVVERIL